MEESGLRISVIGSCRVQDPLIVRGVALDQRGLDGYTHNTKEHLQLLAEPSAEPLAGPISRITNLPARRAAVDVADPDRWFVVEICSVRVVKYDAWYMQINKFAQYVQELGGADFNALSFKSQEALRGRLAQIPDLTFDGARIEFYEQGEDEVYADALEINRRLGGRALFVCHWDVDQLGRTIPQRSVIRKALSRLAMDEGVFFLDPTPYVKRSPGAFKDLGHYADPFKPVMGRILANRIGEMIGGESSELGSPAGNA